MIVEAAKTDPWTEHQKALFTGPAVTSAQDLAAYTGSAAAERIVGQERRDAYLYNSHQLEINYGGAVEFQLRREQVILCPRTLAFLYGAFTPRTVRYRRGSRPVLEKAAAHATAGCVSPHERTLALMRFCRDLRKKTGPEWSEYLYGGTEEQMIAKPEILCETLGRLMVALCEVSGIPARIIMHDLGGHIVTEVHVEGGWAYVDPRCGVYFVKPDGALASLLDLCRDPTIIRNQPERVRADVSDQWTWALRAWKVENMYCNPAEVHGFQNYSLAHADRYDFSQVPRKQALADGLMEINRRYVSTAHRALGLPPEHDAPD